jgi:hypothetical protein
MVQIGDPINLADFSCLPSDGHCGLLPVKPHESVEMTTTNYFNRCSGGAGPGLEQTVQFTPRPKPGLSPG